MTVAEDEEVARPSLIIAMEVGKQRYQSTTKKNAYLLLELCQLRFQFLNPSQPLVLLVLKVCQLELHGRHLLLDLPLLLQELLLLFSSFLLANINNIV